jgi:hypothetical protein
VDRPIPGIFASITLVATAAQEVLLLLLEGLLDEVAESEVGQEVGEQVGPVFHPAGEEGAIYLFTEHVAGWYLSHRPGFPFAVRLWSVGLYRITQAVSLFYRDSRTSPHSIQGLVQSLQGHGR